jgi:hypothetical protein
MGILRKMTAAAGVIDCDHWLHAVLPPGHRVAPAKVYDMGFILA